jgi:alpha-D-xyloside xylohydrolase
MFGKWAYAFWQCKNKYNTQEELLGVAHESRRQHIPIDNIRAGLVLVVHHGGPVFDKSRYPDPKGHD